MIRLKSIAKGTLIAETVLIVKDKILNVDISSFIKRIAIK